MSTSLAKNLKSPAKGALLKLPRDRKKEEMLAQTRQAMRVMEIVDAKRSCTRSIVGVGQEVDTSSGLAVVRRLPAASDRQGPTSRGEHSHVAGSPRIASATATG